MPSNLSFQKVFHTLENAIGLAKQRHGLISSTLSNIDTPNYKGKDIDFKSALNQAMSEDQGIRMAATDHRHLNFQPEAGFTADTVEAEGEWNGYNYVGIEQTMNRLIENNLTYRAATESLLRKIATLKEVLREGGM